jgi:hypothetical protein
MSLEVWDLLFDELSIELELDSSFLREKLDCALQRFIEQQVLQSLGLLSVHEGWLLEDKTLEEECNVLPSFSLQLNSSTLRYLYSQVSCSRLKPVVETLQHRYPNEFITPVHIDSVLRSS